MSSSTGAARGHARTRRAPRHSRTSPPGVARTRALLTRVVPVVAASWAAGVLSAAAVVGPAWGPFDGPQASAGGPGVTGVPAAAGDGAVATGGGAAGGGAAAEGAGGAGADGTDGADGADGDAVVACTPAPLEVRAAAVLVVGLPHVTRADAELAEAVLALGVGGVFLSGQNIESARQLRSLTAGLRAAADRPLLVAVDEESGRVSATRSILGGGPSPRRLAQRDDPESVRGFAEDLGDDLADVGIDLNFAPTLDLDDGPWDGIIGDRSFSGDVDVASENGLAFAAGLSEAGVIPTVKHFPGHGLSTTDTHIRSAQVEADLEDLAEADLLPFQRAIDAGVPVVMTNHLRYDALDPDLPASLSPEAYDLLREMGFAGVAITDSLGMGAVHQTWDFDESAVMAVAAGADAVLATQGEQAERMRDALVAAVASGDLPEERLTEAAARVTALAGGDTWAMSCLEVALPVLDVPEDLRFTEDPLS